MTSARDQWLCTAGKTLHTNTNIYSATCMYSILSHMYSIAYMYFYVCSAGIGRTGTFIAIDHSIQQAKAEGTVDILSVTHKMREERMGMIQTKVHIT